MDTLAVSFTIKEYAWNYEPDAPIQVGDTGSPPPPSGIKIQDELELSLYGFENTIYLTSSESGLYGANVAVYDLQGRIVFNSKFQDGQLRIAMDHHASGRYIVTLTTKEARIERKVFLN